MATASDAVIVSPGETLVDESGHLRGHGTFVQDGKLVSCQCGVVSRLNKLISVKNISARYVGEVGDVVVGRIGEVFARRWTVDIASQQNASLMLSSVNLSGGVQRRRTVDDQLRMRSVLREADVLSADVHSVLSDGSVSLHARSLRYGKLTNGVLVSVPASLVKRLSQHFLTMLGTVSVVLGKNGNIWISEKSNENSSLQKAAKEGLAEAVEAVKEAAATQSVGVEGRLKIARVANAINLLRMMRRTITPGNIHTVLDCCDTHRIQPKEMLSPATMELLQPLRFE